MTFRLWRCFHLKLVFIIRKSLQGEALILANYGHYTWQLKPVAGKKCALSCTYQSEVHNCEQQLFWERLSSDSGLSRISTIHILVYPLLHYSTYICRNTAAGRQTRWSHVSCWGTSGLPWPVCSSPPSSSSPTSLALSSSLSVWLLLWWGGDIFSLKMEPPLGRSIWTD